MNPHRLFAFLLTLIALGMTHVAADELIDLRSGYGKAKWGMTAKELLAALPGLQERPNANGNQEPSFPVVPPPGYAIPPREVASFHTLVLKGDEPVIETVYTLLDDRLISVERRFHASLAETTLEYLAQALSDQFRPGSVSANPSTVASVVPATPRRLRAQLPSSQSVQLSGYSGATEISASLNYQIQPQVVKEPQTISLLIQNFKLEYELHQEAQRKLQQRQLEAAKREAPAVARPD